jgi:hypothetical protein
VIETIDILGPDLVVLFSFSFFKEVNENSSVMLCSESRFDL